METLAAARYGLRDIDGLNQAESEDPGVRASMTHALSLLGRFGQDIKHDTYGTLRSSSSGESAGGVLRFETLEHSIEGALQELEFIDDKPPTPAEDALSCEESSATETSDHEAAPEAETEEAGAGVQTHDGVAIERKGKHAKAAGTAAKTKVARTKGEKKAKVKVSKAVKKGRALAPSKQASEILTDQQIAVEPSTVEEPVDHERDTSEARKFRALILKQKAEREGWAAKLKRAKEMGLEVVSKVLYRMQNEKEALAKAKKRSTELSNQIRHICALMHRLGLSVLSTASASSRAQDGALLLRDKENESLRSFLDRVREKRDSEPLNLASGLGDPVGEAARAQGFLDIDQIRPLVYAAIGSALSRVMLAEVIETASEDDGEVQQMESKEQQSPPLMALAASVASQKGSSSQNDEGASPKVPATESEAVGALELIFSKQITAEKSKTVADPETAKMVESKKEETVESILQVLPPWEQHMLALLYEQQEMRKALGQLRDHFTQKLKEIQVSVKRGLLERIELTEHCDRMLAALWSFKAELTDSNSPNRVDKDTNAKFGKLMAKLEELSIRLAERDIDYRLLSEDYINVKGENATLLEINRELKEENRCLLMIPRTMAHWDELKAHEDDVEKKALSRDVHMLQGYVSHLRLRLEECRAVELDVRRLNQALYMELLAANTTIADLQDQIKFHTSVDRREAKLLEEQLVAANQAEAEKSERIRELELEVSYLKEQLEAATSKPEVEEPERVLQAEPVEVTADGEHAVPQKRSLRKSLVSTKSRVKSKVVARASSVVPSPTPVAVPARHKQTSKRSSALVQAGADRGLVKRETRAPSRASGGAARADKPISAKDAEGSRLIKIVAPEAQSSVVPVEKGSSLPQRQTPSRDASPSPAAEEPPTLPSADTSAIGSKMAGRAPAFTGDPRNKGFANMMASLGRRRKNGAA
ncbi:kinesin heavy chain-like protein [Cyclospora cayetanensis]|uniref:Kinesin heavy chain-like protein n=1 Tax=Cyclospora cayetanensis TaxID=88456 RepID=A0A1D3CTD6_9EIME|nr:kinesin heavy chain-like protein [Cyclospora cayetanensis]